MQSLECVALFLHQFCEISVETVVTIPYSEERNRIHTEAILSLMIFLGGTLLTSCLYSYFISLPNVNHSHHNYPSLHLLSDWQAKINLKPKTPHLAS